MKEYPLEIQKAGGDEYVVMSKGHHDPDQFMSAVRSAGFDWPLGKPEHRWVKTVPDSTGEFFTRYAFVEQGTRGSWPATYSWEAYGEDQYATPASSAIN